MDSTTPGMARIVYKIQRKTSKDGEWEDFFTCFTKENAALCIIRHHELNKHHKYRIFQAVLILENL